MSIPFAFVVHPLNARHATERHPLLRFLPDRVVENILRRRKVELVSEIEGLRSKTGATAQGWFIGCSLTPNQMVRTLPTQEVYDKIGQCCELANRQGAKLIGLGAFTSIVGDGGVTIAARSPIAVTTGNSYTVATAIQGTLLAAEMLDINIGNATLAVVGATGAIGRTCARVLARQFGRTILVGRDLERTQIVADEIPGSEVSVNIDDIREADVVVTVTSAGNPVIMPDHLRPGAVVCDVARPRDVSAMVSRERPDVLVIEGGLVQVPEGVKFNFNFGFPPQTAYACMSETMILALEGRAESFTLGKDVSVQQVDEISALAEKHGFSLAGFRSFERAVSQEAIQRAKKARITAPSVPRASRSSAVTG